MSRFGNFQARTTGPNDIPSLSAGFRRRIPSPNGSTFDNSAPTPPTRPAPVASSQGINQGPTSGGSPFGSNDKRTYNPALGGVSTSLNPSALRDILEGRGAKTTTQQLVSGPNASASVTRTESPLSRLIGLFGEQVLGEANEAQAAADRQFGRKGEVIDRFRGIIDGGADELRQVGVEESGRLSDIATEERQAFEDESRRIEQKFVDTSAQQAQANITGARRQSQAAIAEIQSNPDLTTDQKQSQISQLRQATAEHATNVAATAGANFIQQQANLLQNLNQQRLTSTQLRQDMERNASAIRIGQTTAALSFQAQGYESLYAMIDANPESVISKASGIAQIIALKQAQANLALSGGPPQRLGGEGQQFNYNFAPFLTGGSNNSFSYGNTQGQV